MRIEFGYLKFLLVECLIKIAVGTSYFTNLHQEFCAIFLPLLAKGQYYVLKSFRKPRWNMEDVVLKYSRLDCKLVSGKCNLYQQIMFFQINTI